MFMIFENSSVDKYTRLIKLVDNKEPNRTIKTYLTHYPVPAVSLHDWSYHWQAIARDDSPLRETRSFPGTSRDCAIMHTLSVEAALTFTFQVVSAYYHAGL